VLAWIAQSPGPLIALCVACGALFLLPGYAMLGALWPRDRHRLTSAERFAAALGVGIALPPLLVYVSHLAGLAWSPVATWLYVGLAAAATLIPTGVRALRDERPSGYWRASGALAWELWLLVAITLLALLVRLYSVRDLRAGLFGDSVHHTMIVQLLLDNGGLFDSYQPYAPLSSFTYHFGFHADVAMFAWLTGTPATQGTLVIGQVLNAAAVPLAYLLTSRIVGATLGDHRPPMAAVAGLWAAALTGFVNLMPAFYVNWGRYTQLAGQLILPVAVAGWVTLLERASTARVRQQVGLIGLCALLMASLMLTHYTVALFGSVMVGSYALALIARAASLRGTARLLVPATFGIGFAVAIVGPWIATTLAGGIARNTGLILAGTDAARIATYAALTPITPTYLKTWMIALAVAGLLIALARRDWRPAIFAVWSALLVLLVVPHTIGLPGTGVVDQFAVYIALYLTVLPLAGYALAAGQDWAAAVLARLPSSGASALARPPIQRALTALAIGAVCVWGVSWSQGVADHSQQLLTPADEHAMAWIRDNVPVDARLLVNSFPAYGGTLIAGTDGGWWIPLLAGRQTNLPPMTYGGERWESSTYYSEVNGLPEALRGRPLRDGTPVRVDLTVPANLQLLRDRGIDYVYSGANPTPGPDRADRIDAAALRTSVDFRLVYDRDGVQIFQLVQ
jgi:hypothetical protein